MASPEYLLIVKCVAEGDMHTPLKSGIKPEHFSGEWAEIWGWMVEYHQKHSQCPSIRSLQNQWGDLDTNEDTTNESFSGLVDEVHDAYTRRKLLETISDTMPSLNGGRTAEALNTLSSGVQQAAVSVAKIRDVDIIQTWEERIQKYETMRNTPNSLRGIPTGFPGLDKITNGLRPQQFIVVAGEPKRGKSWLALIMADEAHRYGKRPMFISFEMSIEEQEARYDAIVSKVPYGNVLSGNLTSRELDTIRAALKLRKNMHPFIMSEDTSSLTTVSAVSAKIKEYQPDVLFIDGVYLMDDENGERKGSPQALTNITRSLKRLAQQYDIPVVATTQVLSWKLNNKTSRAVSADAIGYTSSFAQDSDLLLGIERNPDIDNRAIIRVVHARSSTTGIVNICWNWTTMEFDEVYGDDDE
jgi:replicative DNA helicase